MVNHRNWLLGALWTFCVAVLIEGLAAPNPAGTAPASQTSSAPEASGSAFQIFMTSQLQNIGSGEKTTVSISSQLNSVLPLIGMNGNDTEATSSVSSRDLYTFTQRDLDPIIQKLQDAIQELMNNISSTSFGPLTGASGDEEADSSTTISHEASTSVSNGGNGDASAKVSASVGPDSDGQNIDVPDVNVNNNGGDLGRFIDNEENQSLNDAGIKPRKKKRTLSGPQFFLAGKVQTGPAPSSPQCSCK